MHAFEGQYYFKAKLRNEVNQCYSEIEKITLVMPEEWLNARNLYVGVSNGVIINITAAIGGLWGK